MSIIGKRDGTNFVEVNIPKCGIHEAIDIGSKHQVSSNYNGSALYERPIPVNVFEHKSPDMKLSIESSLLGHLIGTITDNNDISITYFESGAVVTGIGIAEPIICRFHFPKIGNPAIVSPDQGQEIGNYARATFDRIKESTYKSIIRKSPHFFEEMFSDKFFLRAVNSEANLKDILLIPEIKVDLAISPLTNERDVIISIPLGPDPSVPLHDKRFFDLMFKFVSDFVLAPRGIFAIQTNIFWY